MRAFYAHLLLLFLASTPVALASPVTHFEQCWWNPPLTISNTVWPEGDGEHWESITLTIPTPCQMDVPVRIQYECCEPYPPPDAWGNSIGFGAGVIRAGETALTLDVRVVGNDVYQRLRTFDFLVSFPEPYFWIDVPFTVELIEDDPMAVVTADDVSVNEQDGSVSISIRASVPSTGSVWVAARAETATPEDYDPVIQDFFPHGSLPFNGGTEVRTHIRIYDDNQAEGNETFRVDISASGDIVLARPSLRVTIIDDDIGVSTIPDTVWPEGDGQSEGAITVTLDRPYPVDLDVSAGAHAEGGSEDRERGWVNLQFASGPHTIPAGETQRQIPFLITGNDSYQSTEKVWHAWVDVDGPELTQGHVNFEIRLTEDDPIPVVTVADVSVPEGQGGQTQALVTLTSAAPVTGHVSMRLIEDTAKALSDYDPASCCANPIEFNNTNTAIATFLLWGDTVPEEDETVLVELYDAFDLQLARTSARVTVVDDDYVDATANFSPHDLSLYSGETALVRVSLQPPSEEAKPLTLWTASSLLMVPPSITIPASETASFDVTAMTPGTDTLQCSGYHVRCDGIPVTVMAPTIARISPDHGSTAGGIEVSIHGEGFSTGCGVTFGGIPPQQTSVAARHMILATTPAHDIGTVDVTVTCGSVTLVLDDAFRFEEPTVARRRSVRH